MIEIGIGHPSAAVSCRCPRPTCRWSTDARHRSSCIRHAIRREFPPRAGRVERRSARVDSRLGSARDGIPQSRSGRTSARRFVRKSSSNSSPATTAACSVCASGSGPRLPSSSATSILTSRNNRPACRSPVRRGSTSPEDGGYFGYHNHPMASWSGVYCVADGDPDPTFSNNGCLVFPHPLTAANAFLDSANSTLRWPFSPGQFRAQSQTGSVGAVPILVRALRHALPRQRTADHGRLQRLVQPRSLKSGAVVFLTRTITRPQKNGPLSEAVFVTHINYDQNFWLYCRYQKPPPGRS